MAVKTEAGVIRTVLHSISCPCYTLQQNFPQQSKKATVTAYT